MVYRCLRRRNLVSLAVLGAVAGCLQNSGGSGSVANGTGSGGSSGGNTITNTYLALVANYNGLQTEYKSEQTRNQGFQAVMIDNKNYCLNSVVITSLELDVVSGRLPSVPLTGTQFTETTVNWFTITVASGETPPLKTLTCMHDESSSQLASSLPPYNDNATNAHDQNPLSVFSTGGKIVCSFPNNQNITIGDLAVLTITKNQADYDVYDPTTDPNACLNVNPCPYNMQIQETDRYGLDGVSLYANGVLIYQKSNLNVAISQYPTANAQGTVTDSRTPGLMLVEPDVRLNESFMEALSQTAQTQCANL